MIRRLFWLTLGAVLGVTGYRRLTALARSVPPALRGGLGGSSPRGHGWVSELTRFAADVREGMALYSQRHARPGAPTLEAHTDDVKDDRHGLR